MRKPKRGGKVWREALREAVLSYCPTLIECCKCGFPCINGYVCQCGCDDEEVEEVIDLSEWI